MTALSVILFLIFIDQYISNINNRLIDSASIPYNDTYSTTYKSYVRDTDLMLHPTTEKKKASVFSPSQSRNDSTLSNKTRVKIINIPVKIDSIIDDVQLHGLYLYGDDEYTMDDLKYFADDDYLIQESRTNITFVISNNSSSMSNSSKMIVMNPFQSIKSLQVKLMLLIKVTVPMILIVGIIGYTF